MTILAQNLTGPLFKGTYIEKWSNGTICRSDCWFDRTSRTCLILSPADNYDEIDLDNAELVEQHVSFPNGTTIYDNVNYMANF